MNNIFNTRVSIGQSKRSKNVREGKLSRERFESFTVLDGEPDEKDGAYYTPALMEGNVRSGSLIQHVELLVIDCDNVTPEDVAKTQELIADSGLECIQHTTFSHTPEVPKWRYIFKSSRPMSSREYACAIPQIATEMGIEEFDGVSKVAANPMFFPMVHESRLGTQEFIYQEGEPVDVDPYMMTMVNDDSPEEYESPQALYDPLPIPGALSEHNWLSAVLQAFPAKATDGYPEWSEVGMALYHQTDGRAFDVWLDWSRKDTERHGRKITEDEMRHGKWPSFHRGKSDGKIVTLRKVLNKRRSLTGRSVLAVAYKNLLGMITSPSDLARVTTDIKDDKYLHGPDRRVIGPAYREASRRANDDVMSLGDAMMVISPGSAVDGTKDFFLTGTSSMKLNLNITISIPSEQSL